MYQLRLYGPSFELDNRTVYRKLKAFLVDTPAWAWIEPYDLAENGRAAHQAWVNHYNGQGELSKRTAMAKTRLAALFYKNERSLPFETCSEIMSKCFNTLHKGLDQRLSDRQKVEKLLSIITCDNTELIAAKVYINVEFKTTLSKLAISSLRRWPESMAQLCSRTSATSPASVRSLRSIAKPAAVAEDVVALVAEEVDRAEDATGTPAQSMESTLMTPTKASRGLNGRLS
jgi:hypothetical protein